MKRLLIGLTALIGLTTSSCALSILATTLPKDLIRQNVVCPNDRKAKVENFQILSTQRWSQGVIVLYSALCPAKEKQEGMQKVLGHKVLKRHGISWLVSGGDSYTSDDQPAHKAEKLLDYDISKALPTPAGKTVVKTDRSVKPGAARQENYTLIYGKVLHKKVAAIEATFDNGMILRDRIENQVFALMAPGATGVCELRVLGSDNQILRQEDLAMPKRLAKLQKARLCLPVSHQL